MSNFAIVENSKVINVIVADSAEHAQEVTGLDAYPTDGEPWIDWELTDDGFWKSPKPYESWTWNGQEWVAPEEKPTDGEYYWSEYYNSWKKMPSEGEIP